MRDKRRERQSEGESKAQTALSLTAILHSFHIISSLITHRLFSSEKHTHHSRKCRLGHRTPSSLKLLPAGWSVWTRLHYHLPIPYSTPKPRPTGPCFPSQCCGISGPQTLQPGVPAQSLPSRPEELSQVRMTGQLPDAKPLSPETTEGLC